MNMEQWNSQFANDPSHDFDLYLELVEGTQPQGKVEREPDGELYLSLFACPQVKVPFRWLVGLAERAETLPAPRNEETG
jgi:hypothetical protein